MPRLQALEACHVESGRIGRVGRLEFAPVPDNVEVLVAASPTWAIYGLVDMAHNLGIGEHTKDGAEEGKCEE